MANHSLEGTTYMDVFNAGFMVIGCNLGVPVI